MKVHLYRTLVVALMFVCFVSCNNVTDAKHCDIAEDSLAVVEAQTTSHLTSIDTIDSAIGRWRDERRPIVVDSQTVSVNPYYDEGHDAGYEDGYNDGMENIRNYSYDNSCKYRKWKREEYQLGYEAGYDSGFDDGYADWGGDPDKEE